METKEIVSKSADITLQNVDSVKGEFCKIWPTVKQGLTVLEGLIKNPIAKGAITLVIAAGDAVSKEICG